MGRKSLASRKVYLEVDGRRFALPEGESTVGRSRSCAVVLTDRSVSRTHALVAVYPDRVTLQDLNSSNGTFVNDHRLRGETDILDGDRLVLGKTELRLAWREAEEGEVEPEAEPDAAAEAAEVVPEAELGEGGSPLTRSEALSAGEVLAVGEVLAASESGSWETTGPVFAPDDPGVEAPPPEPAPADPPASALQEAAPAATPAALPPDTAPAVPPADKGTEILSSLDTLDRTLAPVPGGGQERVRPAHPAAGFWPRLGAALFDALWMGLLGLTAAFLAGGPLDPRGQAAGAATFLGLGAVVSVFGWSVYGTTPGKRLLGLYVCREDGWAGLSPGRALVRLLGYVASALPLGAGFLMVGLSPARRGLHDRLAGSSVVRRF